MYKTLVFDYDGTIHETLRIYEPAIRNCVNQLRIAGFSIDEDVPTKRIQSWLGMNALDMWRDFQPDMQEKMRQKASDMVGTFMEDAVYSHQARWYEHAEETLNKLKQYGYSMVILSNSKIRTGEIHFKEFRMEQWFDKWYDCESYGWEPKTEIIKDIQKKYGNDLIMIGDRKSDIDAAKSIGAKAIGCAYGYGTKEELAEADYIISEIRELEELLIRRE